MSRTIEPPATPQDAAELEQAKYNWLTTSEAGRILCGVKEAKVRQWIRAGLLRASNISPGCKRSEYRIAREEAERFKAEVLDG